MNEIFTTAFDFSLVFFCEINFSTITLVLYCRFCYRQRRFLQLDLCDKLSYNDFGLICRCCDRLDKFLSRYQIC